MASLKPANPEIILAPIPLRNTFQVIVWDSLKSVSLQPAIREGGIMGLAMDLGVILSSEIDE